MITVNKIKFHFLVSDLHWVQSLYAEWDSFCERCAIDIIEEVLSSYDIENSTIEIDSLKLNIGDIAQDDFFEEFPIRLRNELRRLLTLSPKLITHPQHSMTQNSLLITHSVQPITHWLSLPTLSRREKIELLANTLRESPDIVLGFIHNTSDRAILITLSDLLESPIVKQIIYAESRSHTEVGIPTYWFSLYEWLYKYYPWGGVAMFGDKESFGRHLNIKLLTFINKLRIGAYLTKSELTIQFILEIFGSEHYLEILRLIYFNQTLDSDSRPIAGDYYTWEIYYILLKHSIITPNARAGQNAQSKEITPLDITETLNRKTLKEICIALTIAEYSYSDRQRLYINLLSRYDEAKLLFALDENNLLENFVQTMPREIIRILLLRFAEDSHPVIRNIVDWIVANDDVVSEILGCPTSTLLHNIIVLLKSWSVERINTNSDEITIFRKFIRGVILDRDDEVKIMSELIKLSRANNSRIFNLMLRLEEYDAEYLNDVKHYNHHYPHRFLAQLKPLSKKEVISLIDDYVIDREDILLCGRNVDTSIAATLRSMTQKVEENVTRWGLFSGSSYELSSSLSKAMLLLIVETHNSGRSLKSEDIISRFFSFWHFVVTGEEQIDNSSNWQSAMNEVVNCDLTVKIEDEIEEFKEEVKYSRLALDNFEEFASWLLSDIVDNATKCEVINYYIKNSPRVLLNFIKYTISNEQLSLRLLSQWLTIEGLICICASISYQLYEAIYNVSIYILNSRAIPVWELFEKIVHFMLNHNEGVLRSYSRKTLTQKVSEHFNIIAEKLNQSNMTEDKLLHETTSKDDINIYPQYISTPRLSESRANLFDMPSVRGEERSSTPSAGLALLSPWFARLFGMTGLLDKDNKQFKSDEAKIRGVFILQRLASPEQRKWRDSELAFNRILVGLPFSTPLPAELELYKEETEAIESMLVGIKAHWRVLANTSIEGFQSSFIARNGNIERRENSWLLQVEPRSYDMLLDSLPWNYRPIRLPWLKEWIDVIWRETQEFDC